MKYYRPVFHILLAVCIFGMPPAPAWASKKMSGQLTRMADPEKALSANEAMLIRFQEEREELLRHPIRKTQPHQFRNKLRILNSKITFLEEQISQARKSKKTSGNAVSPRKPSAAPAAPALLKTPAPKPVRVSLKNYAELEPRKGFLLAWSSGMADMQAPMKKEARAGAEKKDMAAIAVEPMAGIPAEGRQTVSEAPVPPANIPAQPAEAPAPQPAVEATSVTPQPLAPFAMRQEMSEAAPAKSSAKTGTDWQEMTRADKEIYMLSVLGNLSRRDVFLMKPYDFYIERVDEAVGANSSLRDEFVHKIVMSAAYQSEPDSRKDLDKVWN